MTGDGLPDRERTTLALRVVLEIEHRGPPGAVDFRNTGRAAELLRLTQDLS